MYHMVKKPKEAKHFTYVLNLACFQGKSSDILIKCYSIKHIITCVNILTLLKNDVQNFIPSVVKSEFDFIYAQYTG